jgi:hypothetical protein
MNLDKIDFSRVAVMMASAVLLATVALFAYEVVKPPVIYATSAERVRKSSAMAAPNAEAGSLYPLPALSHRYEKKLIRAERVRHQRANRWAAHRHWTAGAE